MMLNLFAAIEVGTGQVHEVHRIQKAGRLSPLPGTSAAEQPRDREIHVIRDNILPINDVLAGEIRGGSPISLHADICELVEPNRNRVQPSCNARHSMEEASRVKMKCVRLLKPS